jgi:hypothetical protein
MRCEHGTEGPEYTPFGITWGLDWYWGGGSVYYLLSYIISLIQG